MFCWQHNGRSKELFTFPPIRPFNLSGVVTMYPSRAARRECAGFLCRHNLQISKPLHPLAAVHGYRTEPFRRALAPVVLRGVLGGISVAPPVIRCRCNAASDHNVLGVLWFWVGSARHKTTLAKSKQREAGHLHFGRRRTVTCRRCVSSTIDSKMRRKRER